MRVPEGLSFNARIDKGNALLTLEGKTLTLAPVEGAFGAQYAGEDVLFIARGNEATLTRGNGPADDMHGEVEPRDRPKGRGRLHES